MGPRRSSVSRVALAVIMLLTLGVAGGGVANAQDEDLCFALTTEEIAAAIPGTYDAPAGFPDSCQWHGTSSGGDPVDMVLYAAPGSADDLSTGDTVATTIGGFQGFTASDTTRDPPAGIAAADLGGTVVTLSLSGPSVDPAVVASGLAEIAVGRIAERASGVPAGDDGSGTEPGAGTHGDPCSLFTTDEIAGLMGAPVRAVADFESCRWDSADGGRSVSVSFAEGGLTTIESLYPDGEDATVVGQPAYQIDQGLPGLAGFQVDVDLGPDTMSVLVTSTDETLDVATIAMGLAETAFDRGIAVLPEPEGVVAACQLATPDEIAAAAGLNVKLTMSDFETACNYEGGKGNKHVMVYVATQDPETFDAMIVSVGATEIDGPGESNWWWKDYASLFSRRGDLVLQVAIQPDRQTGEAKLQQMAEAVMEVLLAP